MSSYRPSPPDDGAARVYHILEGHRDKSDVDQSNVRFGVDLLEQGRASHRLVRVLPPINEASAVNAMQ
jgi:hypothetical protein